MIPLYGIIGAALVVPGIAYLYIFARYLLRSKNKELIIPVSEALITIVIGLFYIYSVVILANKREQTLNFTNNIDDILMKNDSFQYSFITTKPEIITETTENIETEIIETEIIETENDVNTEFNTETNEVTDEDTIKTTFASTEKPNEPEVAFLSTTNEETTAPTGVNKTEQFIKNYQTFIKEFIKQKFSNFSALNKTFANIKFGSPANIKTGRKIEFEPTDDDCFNNLFLKNALLLFSFMHCLLSLVNNTVECRKCGEENVDSKEKPKESETSVQSKSDEVLDTSGSASEPVGPLFESTSSKLSQNEPNVKLFQAKSASTRSYNKPSEKEPKLKDKIKNYNFVLQLMVSWLLPIVGVIILYFLIKYYPVLPNFEHIKLKSNFTMSQFEPNSVLNAANITTNSTEVDNIVSRVYEIVNSIKENVNKKTTYFTPIMVDVIYYLQHKPRQSIDPVCFDFDTTATTTLKIVYFIVFVICYFGVILFAKVTETLTKLKHQEKAKQQNICMLSFALLWLPCVLDMFYRIFITQAEATMFSSIFLALGNSNRLQTMIYTHMYAKKYVQNPNFVNPV